MKRSPRLYVFVRAPALGAVKRRLAAGVGAVEALRFYRAATESLLRRVGRDPRWETVLAVTPDTAARGVSPWPAGFARTGQGGGDLGARMGRILAGDPTVPVAIVGSDIPELGARHVESAFVALRNADLVFGPAADGGYWLVGRRPGAATRGLFDGVRWSSPHALADTRANVPPRRKVALLETLEDVDDAEAYASWRVRRNARRGAR
ncbi:MAG: TIGR04282 family arsenosugar biosynthesis glycosyltransferase [Defluviicoccus sp.]|nr:TIGR04282 family arsenosugar biosynthesis glycosyltransferase [Defluviicoccus sp.]MDE0278980.1 TIGR04282 family arsenosugar biosynthesis glycosyltransferase [Defluviicoccus sp.]